MKNCLLSLASLALAMFPYVGLAQAESDEPVTLPEGADVWTCTLEGSYTAIGDNASPLSIRTQVAFDNTDYYIQGLSRTFPEAWIKGTYDWEADIITFPSGQFVGENEDGKFYLVGSELEYEDLAEYGETTDIVFHYNFEGIEDRNLKLETSCVVEAQGKDGSGAYGFWDNEVIYKLDPLVQFSIKFVDTEGHSIRPPYIGKAEINTYIDQSHCPFMYSEFFSEDSLTKYTISETSQIDFYVSEYASDNVFVLIYDTWKACRATVNCMANGTYERLAQYEDIFFMDQGLSIYVPLGIRGKDGKYYFTTPNTEKDGNKHSKYVDFPLQTPPTVRNGMDCYAFIVLYNEDPSVAYYADLETLVLPVEGNEYGVGLGQCEGGFKLRPFCWTNSMSHTIWLNEGAYLWTEPIAEAGTYQVTIFIGATKVTEEPFALGYRDANGEVYLYTNLAIPTYDEIYHGESVVEGVSIPAGASLVVMNRQPDTKSVEFDDIKLVRTGEFAEPIADGVASPVAEKEGGTIYNLAGQRLSKLQRGINIVNGRKILQK